jgi:hypothetical protein
VIWTAEEAFANDLDALDEPGLLANAHDVEGWQETTLVAYVKKGDEPLAVRDPSELAGHPK